VPATVLPDTSRLRLDLLRLDGSAITILMATTPTGPLCPLCGTASSRVHSRYVRILADLPWHGVACLVTSSGSLPISRALPADGRWRQQR
jgi:transposase